MVEMFPHLKRLAGCVWWIIICVHGGVHGVAVNKINAQCHCSQSGTHPSLSSSSSLLRYIFGDPQSGAHSRGQFRISIQTQSTYSF